MANHEFFSIASNLIFLAPLYFSIQEELWVMAALMSMIFVASSIYHTLKPGGPDWWHINGRRNKQQDLWLWVDTIIGWTLVIYTIFLLAGKNWPQPYLFAVLGVVGITLLFWKGKFSYRYTHGLWHLVAGSTILLAIIF